MTRLLTHSQSRKYYDRLGEKQDSQGFYEDAAVDRLKTCGEFDRAGSVLEFGCGTGRFARELFEEELGPDARYTGIDSSPTMIGIATRRLEPFTDRATVQLTDGQPALDQPDSSFDRFVSCYVLDLLSPGDTGAVIAEARRLLAPEGLLCVTSLTHGPGFGTGLVSKLWSAVHRIRPEMVGGCRPIRVSEHLDQSEWTVLRREVATGFMIPSEVVIARPRT